MGLGTIVVVNVLVLGWWGPLLSLSDAEGSSSSLGASVGYCVDIGTYLIIAENGWGARRRYIFL